jgi:hypothetical protein
MTMTTTKMTKKMIGRRTTTKMTEKTIVRRTARREMMVMVMKRKRKKNSNRNRAMSRGRRRSKGTGRLTPPPHRLIDPACSVEDHCPCFLQVPPFLSRSHLH